MTDAEEPLKLKDGAVVWREVDGETIVLAVESSDYLGANESATLLWAALQRGTTRVELVDILVSEYDVSRAQAEADVHAFVDACHIRGFLES